MLAAATALLLGFLQGCGPEPGGEPARNKMPELTNLSNGFEGGGSGFRASKTKDRNEYGLTTVNADMDIMGEREPCVVVSLPSAGMDSVAFILVKTYGVLASPLINEWSKRDRRGVVLDLRENAGSSARSSKTEYMLKSGTGIDIPVVIMWDQRSASRAASYTQTLEHFSGINLQPLSSN